MFCESRLRIGLCFVAFVLTQGLVVGGARPAFADPIEVLIREGVDLRSQGKHEEALPKFQQAYEESRRPRAAAQLGLCEMALQMWQPAQEHLDIALRATTDKWIARNRTVIEDSLKTTRSNLGRLVVKGSPADASVAVNGAYAGRLPEVGPVWVSPGDVEVQVSAANFESLEKSVKLEAGETNTVDVFLLPTPRGDEVSTGLPSGKSSEGAALVRVADTAATEDGEPSVWQSPWLWAGAGAVVVGAVFAALVWSAGETPPMATTQIPLN